MQLPPFERYLLTLRLTAPARFHFLHGGVLRGLLSAALGQHELPVGVVPFPAESGRARFDTGEAYRFGLTLVGQESADAGQILRGLERVGRQAPRKTEGPPPTLGDNFRLEAADLLDAADPDAEAALLEGDLTLRFLSPLRLERPDTLQKRGATFLNEECFPAAHFLERLWSRLFRFVHGRFPTAEDRAGMPPLPAELAAEPGHLPWLDLPVTGGPRKKAYTLGGVVGAVRLSGLPPDWLPLLALGRHLHTGASTSYGFGRYRIEETAERFPEPFRPAASVLELAARRERDVAEALTPAIDTLLADSASAYRKGFSRAGAARALERAYAEGYRFVLDADIETFFDSVPRDRLSEKLAALFPLDPPLLNLLTEWVKADRTKFLRGLPQGAAIPPLLTNLCLDELDEELAREGFRLVRHADKLAVLARDLADARKARIARVPLLNLRELILEEGTGQGRRNVRAVPLTTAPAPAPLRHVITYDVENDQVRTRIATVLAAYGSRVQKSVFECNLEPEALERLTSQLSEELAVAPGGNIRIYRLCTDCYGASIGFGELEEGAGGEPWILV